MAACVCGAPIQWVRTTDGERIALDSVPTLDGEGRFMLVFEADPPTAIRVSPTALLPAYRTHALSCPRT